MIDLLCGCDEHEVSVTVFDPECYGCDVKSDAEAIKFTLKGARLESENFSSSIGENKSVDLVFSTQIGGADDAHRGLFLWGKENVKASIPGIPPAWINEQGEENVPFFSEVPPDAEPFNISRQYLAGKVIQVGTKYYESKIAMNYIN
jgi:hypothetical protein